MKFPSLRNPHVLIPLLLLVLADVGGIVHALRAHGRKDGAIAIVLPPYALYRSIESVRHPEVLDPAAMAKTDAGRRKLRKELQIKPDIWDALIRLVNVQKQNTMHSTMQDSGALFDIAVTVPQTGPISLTIQPRSDPNLTIVMTDADADQTPEILQITKVVNGKPDIYNTEITKYASEDASQFLLAWSLAWGTIAEELKAKVIQPTTP